jgi:hypothetical protein
MKSTIFIHLLDLPAILAILELHIVVQESWRYVTTVAGQRDPGDESPTAMTYDLFLTAPHCLVKDSTEWQSTDCPDDQPKYLKLAEFIFDGSTREAQPFRITTSDYTQPVS